MCVLFAFFSLIGTPIGFLLAWIYCIMLTFSQPVAALFLLFLLLARNSELFLRVLSLVLLFWYGNALVGLFIMPPFFDAVVSVILQYLGLGIFCWLIGKVSRT